MWPKILKDDFAIGVLAIHRGVIAEFQECLQQRPTEERLLAVLRLGTLQDTWSAVNSGKVQHLVQIPQTADLYIAALALRCSGQKPPSSPGWQRFVRNDAVQADEPYRCSSVTSHPQIWNANVDLDIVLGGFNSGFSSIHLHGCVQNGVQPNFVAVSMGKSVCQTVDLFGVAHVLTNPHSNLYGRWSWLMLADQLLFVAPPCSMAGYSRKVAWIWSHNGLCLMSLLCCIITIHKYIYIYMWYPHKRSTLFTL